MAGLLASVRRLNSWGDYPIAEPFAGGAGASLSLLYSEETPHVFINDADVAINAFWWSVTRRPKEFAAKLKGTTANMVEWKRQRGIHSRPSQVSRTDLGFATFYLNRCNRSGIILKGGPIGGNDQKGKWKIDARYNVPELLRRCDEVAEYRSRIVVTGEDGLQFIRKRASDRVFFFIDPPYYEKGPTLYLNSLTHAYHRALARQLQSMPGAAWVMTYDDTPEVRALYESWATVREFQLDYAASGRRKGRELFICPKSLKLPMRQESQAIAW
jgi:DNA adenine methylase